MFLFELRKDKLQLLPLRDGQEEDCEGQLTINSNVEKSLLVVELSYHKVVFKNTILHLTAVTKASSLRGEGWVVACLEHFLLLLGVYDLIKQNFRFCI